MSGMFSLRHSVYYLNDWIIVEHIPAACQDSSAVDINWPFTLVDYTELSVLLQPNDSLPARNLPCWAFQRQINVDLTVFGWPTQRYLTHTQSNTHIIKSLIDDTCNTVNTANFFWFRLVGRHCPQIGAVGVYTAQLAQSSYMVANWMGVETANCQS